MRCTFYPKNVSKLLQNDLYFIADQIRYLRIFCLLKNVLRSFMVCAIFGSLINSRASDENPLVFLHKESLLLKPLH